MMFDILAINLAKTSSSLIKALRLGSGSALPGRVALKICPNILKGFKRQLKDSKFDLFITGTNGKTTSSGILYAICSRVSNTPIISNTMGANLYYGIVSEFVKSANLFGQLPSPDYILEVDEASMPALAQDLKPSTILVTNIFRDQLDRFGELDATLKLIVQGIKASLEPDHKTHIIYNLDDDNLAKLPELIGGDQKFYSYGVISEEGIKNFDSNKVKNTLRPDFYAEVISQDLDSSKISLGEAESRIELNLPMPGLFNVYNATAAAAAAFHNGVSLEDIKLGIENYKVNFGRSELKKYKGKDLKIFLIKNPTGCTEVIKHLVKDKDASFVIALNDDYADGRDVSWIWDAEFDRLANLNSKIYCTGHRARDISVRLKYAGIPTENLVIDENLIASIDKAVTEAKDTVYLLPTYTALLEVNKK